MKLYCPLADQFSDLAFPSLKGGGPIEANSPDAGRSRCRSFPSLKGGGPIEASLVVRSRAAIRAFPSLKGGGPLTRRERAENVRKRNYFAKYGDKARAVLEALLEKHADEGIQTIESVDVLKVQPLTKFGTLLEIVKLFGGAEN